MNVKVRPYKRGGWEVDIRVTLPTGEEHRERVRSPAKTEAASRRWGDDRASFVLANWREVVQKKEADSRTQVPTVAEFEPRFISEYAEANRLKAATISSYKSRLKHHLLPALGEVRLDVIDKQAEQQLKTTLQHLSPKTVNDTLGVLSKMLNVALEWGVIKALPVRLRKLKAMAKPYPFYDFDEFERVVAGAAEIDDRSRAIVLLGGEAGLRRGEMAGLQWGDIDLRKRPGNPNGQITVQRSVFRGEPGSPKGGRTRVIPMTVRLRDALSVLVRHVHTDRVLVDDDGKPIEEGLVNEWMETILRHAGVSQRSRKVHILRHTFCSHLAMRGAPAKVIQELAGHADLTTTMRYMHLSESSRQSAIDLLNHRQPPPNFGDILETGQAK